MKVFADPSIGLHSRAMTRIYENIKRYAPEGIKFTDQVECADLVIFYPIGYDWIGHFATCIDRRQGYVIIQCCLKTSGATIEQWLPWWNAAELVWSYYDLYRSANISGLDQFRPFAAPLGIDEVFLDTGRHSPKSHIVTTGYVSGPPGEAIEDVWIAAGRCGLPVYHVGSWPYNIKRSSEFNHVTQTEGITDSKLKEIYSKAYYTCSLRYVEGFELPAAESLACYARPILFDQPDLWCWYGNNAIYVKESYGEELISQLELVFNNNYHWHVGNRERDDFVSRFSWKQIVSRFWEMVL